MRRVRYSVAMSLDGYIAGPNGEYDWIPMDPDIDFGALFKQFDTRLMGRKSWDEAQRVVAENPGAVMEMPTYVFSRTLRQADCPGAILSNDAAKTVAELKGLQGKDIWLWGGGELFQSLLEARLVDAVELAIVPVLLGKGIPMLPALGKRLTLELEQHRLYRKTGTVLVRYTL
jgi:dihydrofolate reductase